MGHHPTACRRAPLSGIPRDGCLEASTRWSRRRFPRPARQHRRRQLVDRLAVLVEWHLVARVVVREEAGAQPARRDLRPQPGLDEEVSTVLMDLVVDRLRADDHVTVDRELVEVAVDGRLAHPGDRAAGRAQDVPAVVAARVEQTLGDRPAVDIQRTGASDAVAVGVGDDDLDAGDEVVDDERRCGRREEIPVGRDRADLRRHAEAFRRFGGECTLWCDGGRTSDQRQGQERARHLLGSRADSGRARCLGLCWACGRRVGVMPVCSWSWSVEGGRRRSQRTSAGAHTECAVARLSASLTRPEVS